MRKRGTRQRSTNSMQTLVIPASLSSTANAISSFGNASVPVVVGVDRPGRPISLELEHYAQAPRSFTFQVNGFNGEEIYRSPLILTGPIPRKFRCKLPRSTDFATLASAAEIIRFSHATNPGIKWVLNLRVQYKSQSASSYF